MKFTKNPFRSSLFILFFLSLGFVGIFGPTDLFALDKPKEVKATYDAATNQLVVSWKKVSSAKKYNVNVKDSKGKTIVKSDTSGTNKKFAGSKFVTAAKYSVKVKSLSGSTSSSTVSLTYFHELTRAPGVGPLLTQNSFGRSGSYYLPPDFGKKARPLMIAFHGQGGDGLTMINGFKELAKKNGFIIVSPSSGLAPDGTPTWSVGTLPRSFTEDFLHSQDSMTEVLGFTNVKIDTSHVIAIGHSAGAAMAPYYATNNPEFTNFGVLHGGIFLGGFGDRKISAWFSTGATDTLRTPTEVQAYSKILSSLGFNSIYTTFDTDHGISKAESEALIDWWLH